MARDTLLAIDQGTSSSRAIGFSASGDMLAVEQQPFEQIYPAAGWVEHDAEVIWATVMSTGRRALQRLEGHSVAAIGITNQRETTVLWDRRSGAPIYNAIVWQDRRTAERCRELERRHPEALDELRRKTGLLFDPYFSATKIAWILDHVPGARAAAEAGHIAFGTIDSFLLWRLTGGQLHATDATNASRTALYDIVKGRWDEALCELFGVPMACLPEVRDCAGDFGSSSVFGAMLPIRGVAGDQQAALVGQACFRAGEVKSTYGTGAFLVLNTADRLVVSDNRLLGTIAYRLDGKVTYALEGSILSAGTAIQWLRDGLGLISRASDVEALAASVSGSGGVYLVPAFTGLGAPYWDPDARGALIGLTRASSRAEIARAALDSVVYQTYDLLEAMAADGLRPAMLKVDGGMAVNALFMQRLADVLGLPIQRPTIAESTAFGAACLAGLGCGLYRSLDDIAGLARPAARCEPRAYAERDAEIAGWRTALGRVRSSAPA
jgi:glycerol kinase